MQASKYALPHIGSAVSGACPYQDPSPFSSLCAADELTLAIWPHAFEALVTVSLRDSPEEGLGPGCALRYVLQIYNPGPARLSVAIADCKLRFVSSSGTRNARRREGGTTSVTTTGRALVRPCCPSALLWSPGQCRRAIMCLSSPGSPSKNPCPGCALRYDVQIYNPGAARRSVATAGSQSMDVPEPLRVLLSDSLSRSALLLRPADAHPRRCPLLQQLRLSVPSWPLCRRGWSDLPVAVAASGQCPSAAADVDELVFNAEIKPHVKIESVPSTYLWGFEGSQVITHDRAGQARTFAAVRGFPLTGEL